MKKRFNYSEAVELLEKYENAEDVPEDVIKQLHINSKNPDKMEWVEKNFGAIKGGWKDSDDFEEDNLDMMFPEGYDPDVDGDILDED